MESNMIYKFKFVFRSRVEFSSDLPQGEEVDAGETACRRVLFKLTYK